jgi:glycosyltransferase involved in cell wall biosynthesis
MIASGNNIKLSVVVPLFNEEKAIAILYGGIKAVLGALGEKGEIIFIDDGSRDKSGMELDRLQGADQAVRVFKLAAHQGQYKALEKGFSEARGEIVVSMDGDLQNDPHDIFRLIAKLDEGFDLVCGWRRERKDRWQRVIGAKVGNYLQRLITKVRLHDMGCGMRAYRKGIIENLTFNDKYEFSLLPYILSKRTNKITEIKITHKKRIHGKSKYSWAYFLGVINSYIKLLLAENNRKINFSEYAEKNIRSHTGI